MSFFNTIYPLPNGISKAPENIGGVYAFFLRFPSNLELGLLSEDVDLYRTKELILKQLSLVENGLKRFPLKGKLSDLKTGEHMRLNYALNANPIARSSSVTELSRLDVWNSFENQLMLTDMLRQSVATCKPLYVGLAEKQSIRERIISHYELRSTFGRQVKQNNIGWDIVGFSFITVSPEYYSQKNMRTFEKLLQRLTNPIFSEL